MSPSSLLAALCVLLVLRALPSTSGSRLHLHTPKLKALTCGGAVAGRYLGGGRVANPAGQETHCARGNPLAVRAWCSCRAKIVTSDVLGERKAKRWLEVRTGFNERVLVLETKPGDFGGIRSGQEVEMEGVWLSRGAGGWRAVSGFTSAQSSYTFVSTKIKAKKGGTKMAATAATVDTVQVAADRPIGEPHGGGMVAAAATAPAPIPVKIVTNKIFSRSISTIVIPLAGVNPDGTACTGTSLPKWDSAAVRRMVFQELSGANISVGTTFNKCSFKRSVLNITNSMVTEIVKLPCVGESWGVPWSFSKCDFDDFNGWADAADAQLRASGLPLDKYPYRVYMLPPATCPFVGLGYVGCDFSYDCRSWISGDFWATPQVVVHEMSHNLFLGHAGAYTPDGSFDEYADSGCLMGYCCHDRCPNLPHSWQLGWQTVKQLDELSLRAGQTVAFNISAQDASPQSGLRLNASWARGGGDPVFVSFRRRSAGSPDKSLDLSLTGKVLVHTSPLANTFDAAFTTFRAALSVGQTWTGVAGGTAKFVLKYRRSLGGGGSAEVTICRKSPNGLETKASCTAGLNYDCNGLIGTADTACRKLLGLRPRRRSLLADDPAGTWAAAAAASEQGQASQRAADCVGF